MFQFVHLLLTASTPSLAPCPSRPTGWSNKYDEWVEEAGVVRFDKALLEQSAAAAGNAPGDLSGRKRKVGGGGAL